EPDEEAPAEEVAASEPEAPPAPPAEVRISPIAKRVAAKLGVDLTGVVGTGRNGRISKEDVEAAARAQGLLAEESDEPPAFEVIKLTGTQKTAAKRLQEAKQQIPHFYLDADVQTKRLAKVAKRADVSLNAALLKAMGMALEAVPEANVQFVDDTLHRYAKADVGMAVATDRGLVVPILRDVGGASLADIAAAAKDLAVRARDRKLVAADLEGGTCTVSNLGMFGVDRFQAIVNPPQTTILAVGRSVDRAVVDDDDVEVRPVVSVSLSCDHRAVDGALGARLLAAFRAAVESGLEGCE
ncbi:MAG: 2-oxo acid dehydrogenase subunit E2, partial [Pseudomonadota bacterium]